VQLEYTELRNVIGCFATPGELAQTHLRSSHSFLIFSPSSPLPSLLPPQFQSASAWPIEE
jgi:hypothetical protein